MALRLRKLTKEEDTTLEHLLHARKVPAGKLKRAQIIWLASQGLATPEIATQLNVSERAGRSRLRQKKGGHRDRLHHPSRRQCDGVLGPNGSGGRQELPRQATRGSRSGGNQTSRQSQARD